MQLYKSIGHSAASCIQVAKTVIPRSTGLKSKNPLLFRWVNSNKLAAGKATIFLIYFYAYFKA